MRLIASAGPSTLLPGLRRGPQLPARDLLYQSDRLARPSAGHPRPARGRAAGPDLRRLIQLLVVRCLSAAQLAPKADRTLSGARTSLWVPELNCLFLGVRASGNEPAAVWVYRPTP